MSAGASVVVPPMQAAWLSKEAKQGLITVSFEVKAFSDACILVKPLPGSKRWQELERDSSAVRGEYAHLFRATESGRELSEEQFRVETGYVIIIGSHRNSRIRIERNGVEVISVPWDNESEKLNPACFKSYWFCYDSRNIWIGFGRPGAPESKILCSYHDPAPLQGMRSVGLGAWDSHVAFRAIRVLEDRAPIPLPSTHPQHVLGPPSLLAACSSAVKQALSPHNACVLMDLASDLLPVTQDLLSGAVAFVASFLPLIVAADPASFAALPLARLLDVLRSDRLCCPEREVFRAVASWGCASMSTDCATLARPSEDVARALQYVRFPLMSDEDLASIASSPLAGACGALQELLLEALVMRGGEEAWPAQWHAARWGGDGIATRAGSDCGSMDNASADYDRSCVSLQMAGQLQLSPRATRPEGTAAAGQQRAKTIDVDSDPDRPSALRQLPRMVPGMTELLYVHDGDMNGVIAYLGSSFGKGPWINPAVTGNVRVMASSPPSRQTDYKALVSRNFVRVLSAGPRRQNDVSETWWALDLGPDARLACNCYTLRHDASEAFLRSWELQGSLEGDRWVTLRRHEADPTICIKGQFASFPVVSHASRTAYRYFRLFMLGPHASPWSEPPFQMHVGGWELYGYLIQSSAAPG